MNMIPPPTSPTPPTATPPSDDAIDALLRADAHAWRDQYIDNDGFSDQVMARVATTPAPQKLSARARFAIIGGIAALSVVFVILFGAGGNLIIDAAMDIATETVTPAVVAIVAVLATLIASVAILISEK
jgi:hypothetical protein